MFYDCIVLGSGMSGLSTALILAMNGKKIALIEKSPFISPLLKRFKRKNVWCDPGFHYSGGLLPGEQMNVFLRYFGIEDKIKFIPLDQNGFDIIFSASGKKYTIPYGFDRFQEYLCNCFPNSSNAVKMYVKTVKEILADTSFCNFDLEFGKYSTSIFENISLEIFLRNNGAEQELIDLLGNHGMVLYGVKANEVPFLINAYIMGSFYQSASKIENGGDALIKSMVTRLKELDVDIFLNEKVVELEINDSKEVSGIRTEKGNLYQAKHCVSTIHPQLLQNIINHKKVRPAFFNRLNRMENTFSPLIVFFDLDEIPEQLIKSNFYCWNESWGAKDGIAIMAVDKPSKQNGKKSLAVIISVDYNKYVKNIEKGSIHYDEFKEKKIMAILKIITNIFPELSGKIHFLEIAGPTTYQRYTGTVDGSIYGIKQSVNQRSINSQTSIHGLFLGGQSIMPGVLGAIVSSFIAVSKIIEPEKFWNKVRICQ